MGAPACSLLPCGGASHTETFWLFRLLLQLTQPQQTSFALERNLRTQQEVGERVKELHFPEGAMLLMEEVGTPQVGAAPSIRPTCAAPYQSRAGAHLILKDLSHPEGLLSPFTVCLWVTPKAASSSFSSCVPFLFSSAVLSACPLEHPK